MTKKNSNLIQNTSAEDGHSSLSKEETSANSFPLFRRRGVPFLWWGVLIFSLFFNSANAFSFSRNLQVGMTGEDVRALQVILNSDSSTRIAVSGSGSPGNETNYFGALTKSALIRFQRKHNVVATGFFGPLTRQEISDLEKVSASVASQSQTSPIPTPAPVSIPAVNNPDQVYSGTSYFGGAVKVPDMPETRDLRLYQVSPYQISLGGTLTLTGDNITTSSIFHIGDSYSASVTKSSAGTYQVTVPSNVVSGQYQVWLTDSRSSSKNPAFSVDINVVQ